MSQQQKFTHLHVHSHYSLLDGLSKIDDILDKCEKDGMDSIALTDHGVMYGIIEFYQKAKARNMKPILGVEAYIAPEGMKNKRSKIDESRYHLTLLAKNQKGYQNLLKLTTLAHLEGFYYKPRIDYDLLEHYSDGLIGMSGCVSGHIPRLIIANKYEEAKKIAFKMQNIFRKGDFYLEVQHHPNLKEQEIVNKGMFKLAKETNLPLVATQDSHYVYPEDNIAQDILLAIQTGNTIDDDNRKISMKNYDFSLPSPQEMITAFKKHPEAITATQEIAHKCNVKLDFDTIHLPEFKVPEGQNDLDFLKNLVDQGLKKRLGSKKAASKKIKDRIVYEMSVIKKTGYASYFLIVQDFVNWAKNNGIVVGPGRGSAAGSLVSYALNITDINPLDYNLMFERFLNPDRISMPDIDIDFTDVRRDEVIEYARKKYGQDRVAQIITFGTMASRMAIRDVGRALGLAYSFCDRVAKMIPFGYSLKKSLEEVQELKELCQQDKDAAKLIKLAKKLEGVVRHASTHACGVVITKDPLTKHTPLQYTSQKDKTIVTQYEMHGIEDLGLLKMDFLGLRNLTVIENTLKIVKATRNKNIKIAKIPLNDQKTFELLRNGYTTGVFQLESGGMTRYLKKLEPNDMEDIIAMVALYRPGPMELIPSFIRRKHGHEEPEYIHPKLEKVLKNTYGIIVYQEQIIQLAQELGGLSYGEADNLRKAVGKKIAKLLAKQETKLIKGMVDNGIDRTTAQQIWGFIKPFARYGFNRSHAASYAHIAYETAYLKANFPTEFMAALMTAESSNIERIAKLVNDTRSMNIQVLPPDINESWENFTIVKPDKGIPNKIRFGLSAIKNVGDHLITAIIQERKEDGLFKNISDFVERVNHKDLNKKSLESLIKAGVLDRFEERGTLLGNLENILKASKETQKNKANGQTSLFAGQKSMNLQLHLKKYPAITMEEKLSWEKELLGLYISSHPLEKYRSRLEKRTICIDNIQEGSIREKIGGIITSVKKIITKKGNAMIFAELEDLTKNIEVIVFPKILQKDPQVWQENNIVILEGRLDNRSGVPKMICEKFQKIN
jgi:DNA polymerase III subunit alpha